MRLLCRLLARALVLVLLVLLALLVVATAATAQVGAPSSDAPAIAQLIALVAGLVIPFVVALLANAQASDNIKTVLSILATSLTAVGTYLLDVDGSHTWKGMVSVAVIAIVMAVTSRVAWTQQWVDKVLAKKGLIG